jgi:hypothetical protein
VHPIRVNPRSADYPPGSEIRAAMDRFNRAYSEVLALLHQYFNGDPRLLAIATGAMYGIKRQMVTLMRLDSGDGATTVGPAFEWVAPSERRVPGTRIEVIPHGPYLVSGEIAVHEATGALRKSTGTCTLCYGTPSPCCAAPTTSHRGTPGRGRRSTASGATGRSGQSRDGAPTGGSPHPPEPPAPSPPATLTPPANGRSTSSESSRAAPGNNHRRDVALVLYVTISAPGLL